MPNDIWSYLKFSLSASAITVIGKLTSLQQWWFWHLFEFYFYLVFRIELQTSKFSCLGDLNLRHVCLIICDSIKFNSSAITIFGKLLHCNSRGLNIYMSSVLFVLYGGLNHRPWKFSCMETWIWDLRALFLVLLWQCEIQLICNNHNWKFWVHICLSPILFAPVWRLESQPSLGLYFTKLCLVHL